MPRRFSDESGLPNMGDLHSEYDKAVKRLQASAEALVHGCLPSDAALNRSTMPGDDNRTINLEHALNRAREEWTVAGNIFAKIEKRLEHYKKTRLPEV